MRPNRTSHERADGEEQPEISAALVSDYVAGRLDPLMAHYIEAAAQRDPDLHRAIAHARDVRRRVKERLTGSRA